MNKAVLKVIHFVIAAFIGKVAFDFIYSGYMSYMPEDLSFSTLREGLNEQVNEIRKIYIGFYDKSLVAGFLTFVTSFVSLEYIQPIKFFNIFFKDMKKDVKEIKGA